MLLIGIPRRVGQMKPDMIFTDTLFVADVSLDKYFDKPVDASLLLNDCRGMPLLYTNIWVFNNPIVHGFVI